MKRLMVMVMVVLASLMTLAKPTDKLIDALVKVESNGKVTAVGDNGKAVGVLQIHKCVVDDVNRKYKTKYTYADRKDEAKSKEICRKYLEMHGGKYATDETYARIWNGGPKGHKKSATKNYWQRVKNNMDSQFIA